MTEPKIDIEQLIDYVTTDKPIGIETAQRWLKYLLSQTERRGVALGEANAEISRFMDRLQQAERVLKELDEECERIGRDKARIAYEKAVIVANLKKVERERDEYKEKWKAREGYGAKWKAKAEEARAERDQLREANTALLNGLRWYGNTKIYESEYVQHEIEAGDSYYADPLVIEDGGAEARRLLAQYDK